MALLERDAQHEIPSPPPRLGVGRRWSLSGGCEELKAHLPSRRRLSDLSTILEYHHHKSSGCHEEEKELVALQGDGDEQCNEGALLYIDINTNKNKEDLNNTTTHTTTTTLNRNSNSNTPRLLTRTVSSVSCNRTSSRHRRSKRFPSISSISSSIAASLSLSAMASFNNNTTTIPIPPSSTLHHRQSNAPLKSAMRSPPSTSASLDSGINVEGMSLNDSNTTHHRHPASVSSITTSTTTPVDSLATSSSIASSTINSNSNSSSNKRRASHGAYVSRVSFDDTNAIGGGGGTGFEQSYTLRATTSGFIRTRESRTFLVATDLNAYSMHALNWAIDSLIEDGDELVVLRVLDPSTSSISLSRTSLSEQAKEEAASLMRVVEERNSTYTSYQSKHHFSTSDLPNNKDKDDNDVEPINEIGITVEHVIGKVQESIQKIIKVYRPDSLIVGTRGRSDSLLKSAFIGSVSRYCVAESPVPVVVVRPSLKVRKTVDKREGRQTYRDLVEGSGRPGSSSGVPAKVSTGLGMPRSSTLPTGTGASSPRNSSPSRPKTASSTLNKITIPLTKTKTLS